MSKDLAGNVNINLTITIDHVFFHVHDDDWKQTRKENGKSEKKSFPTLNTNWIALLSWGNLNLLSSFQRQIQDNLKANHDADSDAKKYKKQSKCPLGSYQ